MTQQLPQVPPTEANEPELAEVRNFRDVGGLPTTDGRAVRPGRLFRSGHLAHATETDAAFLASLGLHTVFDFRNEADRRSRGRTSSSPAYERGQRRRWRRRRGSRQESGGPAAMGGDARRASVGADGRRAPAALRGQRFRTACRVSRPSMAVPRGRGPMRPLRQVPSRQVF
ncbi:hypothetical protein SNARM312S_07100 [Streptomyces narbonensis]